MVDERITDQKGNVLGRLHIFLDDRIESFGDIEHNIRYTQESGYAGFRDLKSLGQYLRWSLFQENPMKWQKIPIEECVSLITNTLRKCAKDIKMDIIEIYLLPNVDRFVAERMDGVTGITPWKNVMIVHVGKTRKWHQALSATVCHELAHAVAMNFNPRISLQDDLIFEGVAEHFRETVEGGGKAAWSKSLKKREIIAILREVRDQLGNQRLSKDLFFGTGKFPLWAAYAIGYHIVKDYLKTLEVVDWNRILRMPTRTIMKESGYLD